MRRIRRTTTHTALGCFLVVVSACRSKSACVQNGVAVDIVGNHGHEVSIPSDHVGRGVGALYPVRGGTHEHAIMLTDADTKALQAGKAVATRTTSVEGHVHEVNVKCKD